MSDKGRYASGGFVDGPAWTITIERAGHCPHGHPWFRIGGSPRVEHVAPPGDFAPLRCPYRVTYMPREDE